MNATILDPGSTSDLPQRSAPGAPLRQTPKAPTRARSAFWLVLGLLVLSLLPLIFGVLRLIQLAGGAEIMPAKHGSTRRPYRWCSIW